MSSLEKLYDTFFDAHSATSADTPVADDPGTVINTVQTAKCTGVFSPEPDEAGYYTVRMDPPAFSEHARVFRADGVHNVLFFMKHPDQSQPTGFLAHFPRTVEGGEPVSSEELVRDGWKGEVTKHSVSLTLITKRQDGKYGVRKLDQEVNIIGDFSELQPSAAELSSNVSIELRGKTVSGEAVTTYMWTPLVHSDRNDDCIWLLNGEFFDKDNNTWEGKVTRLAPVQLHATSSAD